MDDSRRATFSLKKLSSRDSNKPSTTETLIEVPDEGNMAIDYRDFTDIELSQQQRNGPLESVRRCKVTKHLPSKSSKTPGQKV